MIGYDAAALALALRCHVRDLRPGDEAQRIWFVAWCADHGDGCEETYDTLAEAITRADECQRLRDAEGNASHWRFVVKDRGQGLVVYRAGVATE